MVNQYNDIYVGVCVPHMGIWAAEFGRSLALMFSSFTHATRNWNNLRLGLFTAQGSMIASQRQKLVGSALRAGCTHILFLDSDMKFPQNLLIRLLQHQKPFVAANCTTRSSPTLPVAYGLDGIRLMSKGKTGLEEILHVGLAVALIEAKVFKSMELPLFIQDWIPSMNHHCGEDIFFCHKVAELGYPILVDHDLSQEIGHVGSRVYTHVDTSEELIDQENCYG